MENSVLFLLYNCQHFLQSFLLACEEFTSQRILCEATNKELLVRHTNDIGGHWYFLYWVKNQSIYHESLGFRQYTFCDCESVVCDVKAGSFYKYEFWSTLCCLEVKSDNRKIQLTTKNVRLDLGYLSNKIRVKYFFKKELKMKKNVRQWLHSNLCLDMINYLVCMYLSAMQ